MRRIFNSLSKTKPDSKQKSPVKKSKPSPTKEKRLNTIITKLFDWKQKQSDLKLDQTLTELAQLLVWAEKCNDALFWEIDDMNIFDELYISLFNKNKLAVLQSLILLITNIKGEYWVEKVIISPVVNKILEDNFNEQQNTYLINLLKSIGQRINSTNASLLVQDKHSLFLERCIKLADHEDDMIRTSATNIILNMMNFQSSVISEVFAHASFIQFYFNLCQRFITQISAFDRQIIDGTISTYQINKHLAELDDTIILFEDLSQVKSSEAKAMISKVFYHDVMLSFILPSLSIKVHSSLSLKLGIFMLIKVLPILVKTNFHNQILKLVFSTKIDPFKNTCWYSHKLSPIQKLSVFLCVNSYKKPDVEPYSLQSSRENIVIYLTCKDDNIVYLLTYLLLEIIKSKQYSKLALIECGLYFDEDNQETSSTRSLLLEILMKQLKPPFRVLTIKNIAVLVVKLSQRIDKNTFAMHNEQILLFQAIYKNSIQEVESNFNGASFIKAVEYFEHDSRFIEIKGFQVKHKVGKQAFMIPGQENKHLNFYERCPVTADQCTRLDLFIFGMLRKIRYVMFPSKTFTYQDSFFSKLYQQRLSNQQNLKPGEIFNQQDKTLKCKMFSNSIWIGCAILPDRVNLIIVADDHVASRVILNLKFKYLKAEYQSKNDSSKIIIKVKGYSNAVQDFVQNDDIFIRGDNTIMSQWIMSELQARIKEVQKAEILFLKNYLLKMKEDGVLIQGE